MRHAPIDVSHNIPKSGIKCRYSEEICVKKLYIAVIAAGLFLTGAALLIALVALSDASYRCPGIQCSDAMFVGIGGAVIALIGILIAVFGFRRFKVA